MNEVMTTLLNAHEVFQESRRIDIREEVSFNFLHFFDAASAIFSPRFL